MEDNKEKKIIYLSPAVQIMNQLKKNIIETGTYCQDLQRITYQKLTAMQEENREKLQVDIIILDEFHHCGAPEWGKAIEQLIKNNPNAKILGLSATPMRYFDGEARDMAEELFDGNVASEMSLAEAIATGVLSEPDYTTGLYEYDEIINSLEEKWQKLSDSDKEKNAQEYQESMQQLKTMLNASVEGLPELLESKMTNKDGRYIVYCKDIKDMQKKMQDAQNMFARVNPKMKIMSISSRDEDIITNARTIRRFEEDSGDGELKLLFSVNMLNEGYHLKGLDGVIMMRPTHSPTLYYQQLGRALSVGTGKQPIVIDLVNNIDTIEIIEGFSKSLGDAKTRNSKINTSTRGFSISADTRKIQEMVSKIDELVQRRTNYLSYQEKFELMTEYMRVTGENIKVDTKYKGYNIGTMKMNLRQQYFNGTLKIDEELLAKYIASGIILEEKERIRTSQQEKYEFLMQMVGKSKEELYHAKMESGLSFAAAKRSLQTEYNRGTLKLTPEQIENLRKNGLLGYSREEQEEMAKRMGLPQKYAVDIIKKYGSYEEFIEQYKRGTIDYKFGNDVFCGYRGVTISEQEMTEEQKLRYADFAKDFLFDFDWNFENGDYIDIDKLKICIEEFPERIKECIELYYGLNGPKMKCEQIGKNFGISGSSVSIRIREGIKKYRARLVRKYNPMGNIGDVKIKLQQNENEYRLLQELIRDIENIKSYITDENGNPKKEIEDISLEELGVSDCGYVVKALLRVEEYNITSIKDFIDVVREEEKERERSKLDFIEELDFSVRTFNLLKRANIDSISELVTYTEDDLAKLRHAGRKNIEEIKQKLEQKGLQLGQSIKADDIEINASYCIEILLQNCNYELEWNYEGIRKLEEERKEKLEPELARYNEAMENYLNRENIFDPQGVVPAVKRDREEEKIHIGSDIEDLSFSVPIFNCLKRANIHTIYELRLKTEDELLQIRRYKEKRFGRNKTKARRSWSRTRTRGATRCERK